MALLVPSSDGSLAQWLGLDDIFQGSCYSMTIWIADGDELIFLSGTLQEFEPDSEDEGKYLYPLHTHKRAHAHTP
jgi:hypothetical protein